MKTTVIALIGVGLLVSACEIPAKYTKTGERQIVFGDKVYPVSEFKIAPNQVDSSAAPLYFSVSVMGQQGRCAQATEESCLAKVQQMLSEANSGMGY